jgi:hypothetical protein
MSGGIPMSIQQYTERTSTCNRCRLEDIPVHCIYSEIRIKEWERVALKGEARAARSARMQMLKQAAPPSKKEYLKSPDSDL